MKEFQNFFYNENTDILFEKLIYGKYEKVNAIFYYLDTSLFGYQDC